MLDAVDALTMDALLFQRPDHALEHAILLGAVRGDELLLQAVAADQGRELAGGQNQAVVRAQQERAAAAPEGSERLISACSNALAAVVALRDTRQMPAQQLAGVAIYDQAMTRL